MALVLIRLMIVVIQQFPVQSFLIVWTICKEECGGQELLCLKLYRTDDDQQENDIEQTFHKIGFNNIGKDTIFSEQ